MAIKEALLFLYNSMVNSLPTGLSELPKLIFFAIGLAFYGIFVWAFYRSLASRDIIRLNLKKYNKFEHAGIIKLFAVLFYIIEFIIIIPFIIVIWFAVLSGFLIILLSQQTVGTIFLIAAGIIGAVRITSYYSEDLSRDLAKMFPFTLVSIAILTPGFFNIDTILTNIVSIPTVFHDITLFVVFIIVVELVMRIFFVTYSLIKSSDNTPQVQEK